MKNLNSIFAKSNRDMYYNTSSNCIITKNKVKMKSLLLNRIEKVTGSAISNVRLLTRILILALLFQGIMASAQPPLPNVSVRFTNPVFDCPTKNYCLDVEFLSDTPDQIIYGVNVRFLYDDAILEYIGMSDFHPDYNGQTEEVQTFPPGSGSSFGFGGKLEWVNATVQLESFANPLYISTNSSQWTYLFRVCFHVDDPNSLSLEEFCPSVVWDRLLNPPPPEIGNAGFFPGDDGVVITLVDQTYQQDSSPTDEVVVQFNWEYDQTEQTVGYPVPDECISTKCGTPLPLSDWALYLAIGLMLITSVFIYSRRVNG